MKTDIRRLLKKAEAIRLAHEPNREPPPQYTLFLVFAHAYAMVRGLLGKGPLDETASEERLALCAEIAAMILTLEGRRIGSVLDFSTAEKLETVRLAKRGVQPTFLAVPGCHELAVLAR